MLATGSIMNWFHYFPVDWRTGATVVHDWVAVILFVVVVGHIGMAFADPDSLGSMLGGTIDAGWARTSGPAGTRRSSAWTASRRSSAPRQVPRGRVSKCHLLGCSH